MTEKNPPLGSCQIPHWRELYRAALFEEDRQRLPSRIAEAETALVFRAKELFATRGMNIDEEQAIEDALYALIALRQCLELDRRVFSPEGTREHKN